LLTIKQTGTIFHPILLQNTLINIITKIGNH